LPRTGYPECQEQQWLSDEREQYLKKGGHPVYGEEDITYRYNSLGYRCPEFDENADIRILSVGDSNTFGHGLPQPALYHEHFAEHLRQHLSKSVVNWNLGLRGSSNDYITRILHLALPTLDPDIVLIKFTHPSRREYLTATCHYCNYVPNYNPSDPVTREVFGYFAALSSSYDDQLNFYRNYKSIETILKDRAWIFSFCFTSGCDEILSWTDQSKFAGKFQLVDKARDGGHYGPETHKQIFENYWKKFLETYGGEQLLSDRRM
jgi:hypothetical protein